MLGGGLPHSGIYLVRGAPGAGKTILGNQICFHHAAGGARAVYLTLLAETHDHMLSNLEGLSFFDAGVIGSAITYLNGYTVLERDGLKGVLDLLRRTIRENRATLLVIDGVVTLEQATQSDLAFKKFVHELQTLVGMMRCTVLLLSSGPGRRTPPEYTMVDGILELGYRLRGPRLVRLLFVRKLRGTGFLLGRHMLRIDGDGVRVFARREALPWRTVRVEPGRQPSGIAGLDRALGGGYPAAATTLLFGAPGSGKTLLGLHYLAAGAPAERAVYLGFYEAPEELMAKADRAAIPLRRQVAEGRVEILWSPPLEQVSDELAERLLEAVERTGATRVVIDGMVGLRTTLAYPSRLLRFLSALLTELRASGCTVVMTEESPDLSTPGVRVPMYGLSALFEGLVVLRREEDGVELRRCLNVVKVRDGAHDLALHRFEIGPRGITLDRAPAPRAAARPRRPGRPKPGRKR